MFEPETPPEQPSTPPEKLGTPFRVVLHQPQSAQHDDRGEHADSGVFADEDEISLDEIEAAYLKALETADHAESFNFPESIETGADRVADAEIEPARPEAVDDFAAAATVNETADDEPSSEAPEDSEDRDDSHERLLRPEQVVEAMLFVGGPLLPAKKFLEVLGGTLTTEQIESMLEALNRKYTKQLRPYEIRLLEGGYRLQLRPEFETVRSRTYGQGPREVKLAQDALEVLAFVAYQQPVTREAVIETEKPNVPGLLRQLLRRQLIELDRRQDDTEAVYRTTSRFLELFGLSSLEDLPQAGTFNFK